MGTPSFTDNTKILAAVAVAATIGVGGTLTGLTIGSTEITASKAAQLSVVASSATESALLEDGNAPETGYIYRLTGANNVVTKAQGDTSAHAAGLAGIGNGTLGIAPLTLPTTIVMDGACTPGLPVYLSAATAGIGTHTASALGLVPLFSAKRNVSLLTDASPDYLCEVVPFGPLVGHVGLESKLTLETAADLGCSPEQLSVWFEDFAQAKTVTTVVTREDGWRVIQTAPYAASIATIYLGSSNYQAGIRSASELIEPAADLNSVAWRISARVAVTTTSGYAFVGVQGSDYLLLMGYLADVSTTKFLFSKGTGQVWNASALPATSVEIGDKDTAYHVFDLESDGNHQVRYRLDSAAWTAWFADTGNAGSWAFVTLGSYNSDTKADWMYYARKISR